MVAVVDRLPTRWCSPDRALPLIVYLIYPPEVRSSPDVAAWARTELAAMGSLSSKEVVMMLAILSAFSLWVFAAEWINPTTVILAVDSLVLMQILDWDDVIGNRGAGTR